MAGSMHVFEGELQLDDQLKSECYCYRGCDARRCYERRHGSSGTCVCECHPFGEVSDNEAAVEEG